MNIIHWLFHSVGAPAAAASSPVITQAIARQKIAELETFLQKNDGLIQSFARKNLTLLSQPMEQELLDTVVDFRRSVQKVREIQERIQQIKSLTDSANCTIAAFREEGQAQIQTLTADAATKCQEILDQVQKKELILTMNLLIAVIDAKIQGKNTDALLQLGSFAIRHHEPFSPQAMTFAPLTDAPKSQPTKFDLVKCFYDGNDLFKKEGDFLIADLRGLSDEERARFDQVPQYKISELLGATSHGDIVRAKLVGTNPVPDPKGPIELFKEDVRETFHEKLDFGSRQRLVEEKHWFAPNHVSRQKKQYLEQADHPKWTPDRERTALVDCAESRLFMQALSEKLFRGEWTLSFEQFLHILDHIDAIWVNDLAYLPDSYREDPHYKTFRALFEQTRKDLTNFIMISEAARKSFPKFDPSTPEKHREVLVKDVIGIIESYYRGKEDPDLSFLTEEEKKRYAVILDSVSQFRIQTTHWVLALRDASTKNEAAIIQTLDQMFDQISTLLEHHLEFICLVNSPIIQQELFRQMDPLMEQIFLIRQQPNSQLTPAQKIEKIELLLSNLSLENRIQFEKKYLFLQELIHDSCSLVNNILPALASGVKSFTAGSPDYWNTRQRFEKCQRLFLQCLADQTQTSFALLGKHTYQKAINTLLFPPAAEAAASI